MRRRADHDELHTGKQLCANVQCTSCTLTQTARDALRVRRLIKSESSDSAAIESLAAVSL